MGMNWYQTQKTAWNWKDFNKGLMKGVITGLPLLTPHSPQQHEPTGPIQNAVPMATQHVPTKVQPPTVVPQTQPKPLAVPVKPPAAPVKEPAAKVTTQPVRIDINKIIQIESGGDAEAESGAGAGGIMQIMPDTWDDLVSKMGKPYTEEDRFDRAKNIEVGTYYLNVEIPRLLKSLKVPDTLETRLAAYNWGAGNVGKAFKAYGQDWLKHAPAETQDYVTKYRK